MTDIVEYMDENSGQFADYQYLQQYEPDYEGLQLYDNEYNRMQVFYDKGLVPDGIEGDKLMKQYAKTDILEGNLTTDHFARGFTTDEYNDVLNYYAWDLFDFLALRVSEGRSQLLPRQEYESFAHISMYLRYGELLKALVHLIGHEGLMEIGEAKRKELGSIIDPWSAWAVAVSPNLGGLVLDVTDQIEPNDPRHVERKKWLYTPALALLHGMRDQDGYFHSAQNRYVNQFKDTEVIDFVKEHLQPLGSETKSSFRRFIAEVELYSFLLHYDSRTAMKDSGPYFVEDGKPLILRNAVTSQPFLPWNTISERHDLPRSITIAMVLDPDVIDLEELRVGWTTFTEPSNYLEAIEAGGVFIRDDPEQLEPLPLDQIDVADIENDLPGLQERLSAANQDWYKETSKLSRRQKILNGAYTYYIGFIEPFLTVTDSYDYFCDTFDLWELPPMVNQIYHSLIGGKLHFGAEDIMHGHGWTEFPEQPNETSQYDNNLADAREVGWQSDLTGMNSIPEYWEDKMDEHNVLEVPLTQMEGKVPPAEVGDFLEQLS